MNSITKNSSNNNKNIINNNYNSTSTNKPSSFSHRITSSISSSSSSSFSSYNSFLEEDFSLPNSPSTSSKIPFSWESIPGIPKAQILKKIDSSKKLPYSNKNLPLPMPPHVCTSSNNNITSCNKNFKQKKSYIARSSDPFFDALVECSKGDDEDDIIGGSGGSIWKGSVKSLSARFGLVNLSCKNSSSIAHSLVFVPKVVGPRRISYLKKRFG